MLISTQVKVTKTLITKRINMLNVKYRLAVELGR